MGGQFKWGARFAQHACIRISRRSEMSTLARPYRQGFFQWYNMKGRERTDLLPAHSTQSSVRRSRHSLASMASFEDAIAARDAALEEIAGLSSAQRNQVSAVVGGVNEETGETAVGIKRSGEDYGKCAEDLCAEEFGEHAELFLMSPAIRPRTGEIIPVCKRCQSKYRRDQFPPGTPFEE